MRPTRTPLTTHRRTSYWQIWQMEGFDKAFGIQRLGDFSIVKDLHSKLWCALDRSAIRYDRARDVHKVLGVAAAVEKSAMDAPCISVRKYLIDNVHDGSGTKSDKHNTLLLDIAFLHALLAKRAPSRALWRGKTFSDIPTLQVNLTAAAPVNAPSPSRQRPFASA